MSNDNNVRIGLRESATFDRNTMAEIRRAADTGIYDIRGFGAKRKLPHFDDLLFLGASMSRYPLEGYREYPDHHRRYELWRSVCQCQGGSGMGGL